MTEFYGTMNLENAEKIMNMIHDKLRGKEYVFTSVNEGFSFGNHVDMRQARLDGYPPSFWNEDNHAGFHFGDGWVWGMSTTQKEEKYDHEYNSPYVVIEHRKIKITHRAPAGHLLHWQILILETGE